MKKYFIFLLLALLPFAGCKEDNPTEPESNDKTPPSISIQSPTTEEGYVTINSSLNFDGSVSDDQGIKEIKWYLNSVEGGSITPGSTWSVQNVALQNGDNTFIISCKDNGGNMAADTIIVTKNQSIAFLSAPRIDPGGIAVNQYSTITVTVPLQVSNKLVSDEVKLVKLIGTNTYQALGQLYDDGNLSHGDEIGNDGVFSGKIYLTETNTGNLKLRVSAKSQETSGKVENYSTFINLLVFEPIEDAEFTKFEEIQDDAVAKLNEFSGEKNMDVILSKTNDWILTQPEVSSTSISGTNIIINYKSGLIGGICISQENQSGEVTTKGGVSFDTARANTKTIPLTKQTRGTNSKVLSKKGNALDIDPNIIKDKDILIYAPFEMAFTPDMRPSLETIIAKSDLEFNVTTYTNAAANIGVLYTLAQYGLIIFDTHGAAGDWILTGEWVTEANKVAYQPLLQLNRIGIFKQVTVTTAWFFKIKADLYGVRSSFISSIPGTFPRSVIINGSCESTKSNLLENAFVGKGAKTYYGFDKIVNTTFCAKVSDSVVAGLVRDFKTTGESFTPDQIDPQSPKALFQIKGSQSMYFSAGLINGDFELGNLDAWTKDGDGRVITRLGSILPFGKFFGIISTGLGYTTATGQISQSFRISQTESKLKVKWNFLSEEFLEYIGSQYQDYFRILIKTKDGTETILISKTIDNLAADFGATQQSAGSLALVSPEISFDRGNVYKTDWITSEFDVTPYRGKAVTLILKAGDVGDSIYDSAILLDDITVE